MPKTKEQKKDILQKLADYIAKQNSILFLEYKGLKVKELLELRKQLKVNGAKFFVAKKTLLQKALQEKGITADVTGFTGQIAAVFAFEDALAPIKSANIFSTTHSNLKMVAGFMDKEFMDASKVMQLAMLPSRKELLGMLLNTMSGPARGFAVVLQGNLRGLVVALNAIKEKK